MLDGKRGIAQTVCYDAFKMVESKTGKDAMEVFNAGMQNILPSLEVKARRVGGATYQVPIEIRPERRQTLALRWIVDFARKRGEKTMAERLCGEIIDASNNTGAAGGNAMIVLLTGGSGCGKSTYAERIVASLPEKKRVYVATMQVYDEELPLAAHRHD